jgi:hypothetical protein
VFAGALQMRNKPVVLSRCTSTLAAIKVMHTLHRVVPEPVRAVHALRARWPLLQVPILAVSL